MVLTLLLLASMAFGTISASAYYSGQAVGFGTVSSSSYRTVGTGLRYDNTVVKGYSGGNQRLQTLTFNPKTSNYVPLVYSQFSGYGGTTINTAKAAETAGYDVKGGVNASFFSMTGSSCNTYGGVVISDGRIIQGNNEHDGTFELAFQSDGTASLIWSRVAYSISARNGAWGAPLTYVNICPDSAAKTYTGIYYYDSACGTSTDTKAAGIEVVFEKINHTQLTVGGTLEGKVVALRNVSSGAAIGANQFVLYASNSSAYAGALRSLAVGEIVKVTATETVDGAKYVMENCNSAVVTYGYHVVYNGVNVTSSNGLGDSFNKARAQRTGIGVKADGTVIIVASPGRTTTNSGMTVYELGNYLISQGCVMGIDLDGGGSTQMTVENTSGTLSSVLSSSRRVANSILVVARPAISASDRNELSALIAKANTLLAGQLSGDVASLNSALYYSNGVLSSSKSMPGDYTKAIMRMNTAIANVKIGYNAGIYRINSASPLYASASASSGSVASLAAGKTLTVTQVSGSFGYTKYLNQYGWINLASATYLGAASQTAATITTPAYAYKGQNVTLSWSAVNGASSYSYRVIELNGEPNPGSTNEALNARVLAEGNVTDSLSVTIPASSRIDGKYLKIAVCVNYPQGSSWSIAYVTTSALPFTDVSPAHWGYGAVKHCYSNGYFSGTSATTFDPNASMTRAMMAVVLYRMAGCPEVDSSVVVPFTDLNKNAWYYNGVAWCYSKGIVTGVSATELAPDMSVTREQAACFLYRLAGALGYDTQVNDINAINSFSDASSVGSYAVTAMAWAVENNIMRGSDSMLLPKNSATRVQIASLLYNFDTVYR